MIKAKKEKIKTKKEPKAKKPAAIKKAQTVKTLPKPKTSAKPVIKKAVVLKHKKADLKKEEVIPVTTVEQKVKAAKTPVVKEHIPKPEIKKEAPEQRKVPLPGQQQAPLPSSKPEIKGPVKTSAVKPAAAVKTVKQEPVYHKEQAPEKPEVKTVQPERKLKELELKLPITVKDLSVKLQEKPSVLIKMLMEMKILAGMNQPLGQDIVSKIAEKYGFAIVMAPDEEAQILKVHQDKDAPGALKPRPPIVTFMGHVDHGKTSLLDAIRKTKVVESEHGGITQHIGAYRVILPGGEITFLDTPGHEAFTAMRARGASITDIVVLVVAADEGIMPQTKEAIDHAKAAGVSIIVALNKIDRQQANVDKVKKELAELNLTPEDWGGKTITVPVSAKTGQGIDNLLEMILLESQMLELKGNPDRPANGIVIESKLTKGKGIVVTLLVKSGVLHLNENLIVGNFYGRIRAMFDDRGRSVTKAGMSNPVEVLGISGIPQAGEQFFVVKDEKEARSLSNIRQDKEKEEQLAPIKRISLEDLHDQIQQGKIKDLKLIIKADVQGSIEAIKDMLNKLNVSEIKLDIIHEGVGSINSSDIILAVASNALVLGFNVPVEDKAAELVAKEGVDVRTYNIIYELGNDIKAAVEGMLEPKLKKVFLGKAQVKKVFKLSRESGLIAGCQVIKGTITRSASVSLLRNGSEVIETKISSLKRFKDDVREVAEGYECGISLANFNEIMEGDVIEAFELEKIARKL
ncbi:MAG: translation initiation factor IF-2 [Candidatus Omnitrophota bacterium]|jgi:translation initiation factor IF-2|nr:MAG: translation initiation factor IF-2 [Candidatus Omnitrophota bacterium]